MIIALKTAGPVTELWLYRDGRSDVSQPLQHERWESGRMLADDILSRLHRLLQQESGGWDDLTGLVIFRGPGSFTSLRIGHTVANALATSRQLPIIGSEGEDWLRSGLSGLSHQPVGVPVWPHYGGEANITRPKEA